MRRSAEYVHGRLCFINTHENVIFSVCARMGILRSSSQSTWWVDQICFLQHQNPTWNTWDRNFECPCNADVHAKIPALFMSILWPRLCVHLYCTHWLWLYSCLSSLTDWSIASIQGTPDTRHHTHTHTDRVKCWARVPRLKKCLNYKLLSDSTLKKE